MSYGDQTMRRRTVLALLGTGSALAVAGCGGDGGDGADGDDTPTDQGDEVPSEYRTATSLNGNERDPDQLSTKEAVNYQEEPEDGDKCADCRYYIEDKNGDGLGACSLVDGKINPEGWCVSYVAYEEGGSEAAVEPVEVPSDASCAVCDMKAAKFDEWNAQLLHEDGTREFFCTSGCAVTYYVTPSTFADDPADVTAMWVTGHESGSFTDAESVSFALETDSDRLDDPMRLNPVPFTSRDDALDYVDAVDYLTADDVVELSAFDMDLAKQYRKRFLEETG